MKKTWKVLALVLCMTMLLTMAVACKKDESNTNSVIIGSATELSGSDFRTSAWGNNAADKDIRDLTNGYACVQQNQKGEYVWDTTVVVKNYEIIDNADGSKTFKITINEGLKYSDGTAITAKDYVGYALAMATPVVKDAGIDAPSGSSYVGFTEFSSATAPTPFAGIRLYDDYTFSYTMLADFFPYYYEATYAAFQPYSLKLWLGEDVEVKDDGQGAYLTEAWYAKKTDANGTEVYAKAEQLTAARYATTEGACSGPYKFEKWDASAKECTLVINENYQGNFEGQKPSIEKITYIKVVAETQLDLFANGGVDVISGLSEGEEINSALALVKNSDGKFAYTNYLRAGYGKLQLVGDYGPTQFTKVRYALSYLLDKNTFASTFTGGYGSLVKGPYGLSSWMYQETKDTLEAKLNGFDFSVDQAMKVLEEDGWVYNADGTAYSGTGVRYKKLTAEEAAVNGNATYKCGNSDYQTVKVGDDYYMPLAINWCSSENNPVSELLVTMLQKAKTTEQAGMVIEQDIVDFTTLLDALYRRGSSTTPKYGMFNLATGFTPVYDYAGYWMPKYSKSNLTYAGVTPCEGATYTEADASKYTKEENEAIDGTWRIYMGQGNSGWFSDAVLDQTSWDMVYKASNKEEFKQYFVDYIVRWNEVLPEIALYSNLYHDIYNAKIVGYEVNPDWGVANAIVYCSIKNAK